MAKAHPKGAFIFRRDLRLDDNLGLLKLLKQCEEVLPLFIFDDRQIDPKQNPFFGSPAFSFLLQSLQELNKALESHGSKLFIFHGQPEDVCASLITHDGVSIVGCNKDYTPFARTRDQAIADACAAAGASFERFDDLCLSSIETIRTQEDRLYTVFTPFMKNAATHDVSIPQKNNFSNYTTSVTTTKAVKLSDYTADVGERKLVLEGGREEGLKILKNNHYLKDYKERRNLPADHGTSRLSAHHKFGTISIRETYHATAQAVGRGSHFIFELYWRDFYYYIAYHFPIVFKQSFLPWAKHIKWINDEKQFAAWCEGRTGVPMVDAGMREMNQTGWMHNRSRMIVASYLTKNLLIDWCWGEKFFAQNLIDFDPAQNNGGWQWSASTGADPRPLRIFNPYTQAEKYDPEAVYIKRWVPELTDVPASKLADGKTQTFQEWAPEYPTPIVDQKESYHRTMAIFKAAKQSWKDENAAANQ